MSVDNLKKKKLIYPGQDEEERQQQLRERARKLIAEARMGVVSPTSPNPLVIKIRSPLSEENLIGKRESPDKKSPSPSENSLKVPIAVKLFHYLISSY